MNPSLDYLPNEDKDVEFVKRPRYVIEVVNGWNWIDQEFQFDIFPWNICLKHWGGKGNKNFQLTVHMPYSKIDPNLGKINPIFCLIFS